MTRLIPFLVAAVPVAGLAALDGGYLPTEWGWAGIVFVLVAGTVLLAAERLALGRLDLAFAGGLAAFAGWVALSTAWSAGATQPVLEAERALVYAVGVLAFLLVGGPAPLAAGVLAGVTGVAAYALVERNPGQLAEPVGYWNALGILAALGILVALGFATRGRGAAGAALVVLAPVLYLTFSRGAWVALAAGALVALALAPDRLRLTAVGPVLLAAPALAVALARELGAGALIGAVAALAVAGAGVTQLLPWLERGVRPGRRVRRAYAGALAVVALAAAGLGAAKLPDAVDAFRAPLPSTGGNLERRLTSFSGNGRADYWRVAWHEVAEHPVLGAGAGSYERAWLRDRPTAFYARDAHNLYLETLAELGPVGLLLLAAALGVPLAAAVRVRRLPGAPAVAGAYAAFLVHAAVDWDWEVPAVTLAGLACAAALVVWARPAQAGLVLETRVRAGALAALGLVAALFFVLQIGNGAVAAADEALDAGDLSRAAADARRARRFAPWSYEPWQRLGEAHLQAGDSVAAGASFREAIERDPENWSLWLDLALASEGPARDGALEQVIRLNPLSPEAGDLLGGS